jgi:hypothetical protein
LCKFNGKYITTFWCCELIMEENIVVRSLHYLDVQHIMHEINMFYTSQQNRFIEHDNQIVTKATHNMYVKGLPLCLWVKVIHIVAYLANKLNQIHLGDTPYEIWHGTKLAISHYEMNLIILPTCSLIDNYNPNGMLRTPSWCLLDTRL